jgi:osmoprotectant transport system substrate-binding protein
VAAPARATLALAALAVCIAGCGSGAARTDPGERVLASGKVDALPGAGKPLVTIGDKNFTEQFILGELYAQALRSQGYSVVLNRDIGPTEVTLRALSSGRLSMYPEYVGAWNTAIARLRHGFRDARAAIGAARRYAGEQGLTLLAPTPFDNTGAIAVRNEYAHTNRLRTVADLRRVAQSLVLGAPAQFQQAAGGLSRLEQSYGFVPAAVKALAIGSQYQALDRGIVQAAYVSTTDGALSNGQYSLLKDPRRVFGWGQALPVVPDKVLQAEGPAFARTINRVSALLSLGTIRRLNAAVDLFSQDPTQVAKRFLQAHGVIPRQKSG